MATEPAELKEYVYVVNNMKTTALLTPKMAERLGAVAVDDDPQTRNGGYTQGQNQAVYSASDMNTGVTGEAAVKPVRKQQQGVDEQGRTKSMLPPPDSGAEPNTEPENDDDKSTPDTSVSTKVRRAKDK